MQTESVFQCCEHAKQSQNIQNCRNKIPNIVWTVANIVLQFCSLVFKSCRLCSWRNYQIMQLSSAVLQLVFACSHTWCASVCKFDFVNHASMVLFKFARITLCCKSPSQHGPFCSSVSDLLRLFAHLVFKQYKLVSHVFANLVCMCFAICASLC